jgi:5-methylcytosine-specific restriction endonuclease McrA
VYRKYMRLAIMMRDGTACWLCGRDDLVEPTEEPGGNTVYNPLLMTFDHVIPRSHGGWDDYTNLKLACAKCNSKRGDRIDFLPKRIRRRAERAAKRRNKSKAHPPTILVAASENRKRDVDKTV